MSEEQKQQQQKKPKEAKKGKGGGGGKPKGKKGGKKGGQRFADRPTPAAVQRRIDLFEVYKKRREDEGPAVAEAEIVMKLPDGKEVPAVAGRTTPMEIAKGISSQMAKRMVVATVDGGYWDLLRPLERSGELQLHDFKSEQGKHAFWHSSAHMLGMAMEMEYDCRLCIGPPLEDGGFYYDCEMGDRKVHPDDFDALQGWMQELAKGKHPFERITMTKDEALEMFSDNVFKQRIIQSKVPDGERCTAYKCGRMIDLCKGPHVPNTGMIKAFEVTKNSSAYWLGKAENETLQRIYGISFPSTKELKEWRHFMELAAKNDHRRLGVEQQLFFFDDVSPGSAFFLPHGGRVYSRLVDFIKSEYWQRGFEEVVTPNTYSTELWKTSGHYDNYRDNMFLFKCEGQEFGIKPMNCPGHCVMFGHTNRSYRDLPIRVADFGVLHRNELSGALSGLTRVRRFQQDDAHIFCRVDQIEDEIAGALDFLEAVYSKFGFSYELNLSTRPEKFLGDVEVWDRAEKALADSLDRTGKEWKLNPGDGAFYGPKVDIRLTDALNRKHQCATIQLDFQLPRRFNLHFKAQDGAAEVPVIIHRAILGSVERFFAIALESFGGKWPLWLSPRQAIVVPVSPKYIDYAHEVRGKLHKAGYYCDVDDSRNQLGKSIRNAQLAQYNYILVVGEEEMVHGSVNIRTRSNEVHGTKTVGALLEQLASEVSEFK